MVETRELARREAAAHGDLLDLARSVSTFDAIRILALRLDGRDLSTKFAVSFHVEEARGAFGWIVRVKIADFDRARILTTKAGGGDPDEIELRIKSDVGALELAGHSLSQARPAGWRSPTDVRFDRGTFAARGSEVESALFRIRRELALRIETRIRQDLDRLRADGRSFDVGSGWGEVVRHDDPNEIVVEAEEPSV